MHCLHPHCPSAAKPGTWDDVVAHPDMKVKEADRAALASALAASFGPLSSTPIARPLPHMPVAQRLGLMKLCPCLHNQIPISATARAVVHFCEITLGQPIDASNVHAAFLIQHPKTGAFKFPPIEGAKSGGTVMELLCSEALTNEGIPVMELGKDRWPNWTMPGHVLLNEGAMDVLKAFGDILIPCAPTNLVISVKSEVARERLLYSANSIEGVGFGFFKEPEEFWTVSRMSLYKRMGFSAIYMPDGTHELVMNHLDVEGTRAHAVSINGNALYRPLSIFGHDMRKVVGRSSTLL